MHMFKPIAFRIEKNLNSTEANHDSVSARIVSGNNPVFFRREDGTRVLEVNGGGAKEKMTRRRLSLLMRSVVQKAKSYGIAKLSISLADFSFRNMRFQERALAELLATEFELANFEFVKYKTPPADGWKQVEEVFVSGRSLQDIRRGTERGQIIAREVNACRTLANMPGGDMTPRLLADEARNAAEGLPVDVTVLGKSQVEQMGMGGVLGVARGSEEEPQFIIMRYDGSKRFSKYPIVYVGKGVTFDTGGLNLKPSDAIYEMHMDMSGGAAVIHAVTLAARLGVKRNVVGLVPAVENMPSGSSYRPGDVLRSLSGKTIEVLNTDAEGRIILADAITFAKRYNPQLVVDVATLTGAALVALGQRCSAIFTEDQKLERNLRQWGEESGDYVWPLPLWSEYEEEIKGTFGDVANVGKTKYGGAITAAKFLHTFAKELACPWVHIDMAPRMTSVEGEHLAKGSVGTPVRLLLKILEEYK